MSVKECKEVIRGVYRLALLLIEKIYRIEVEVDKIQLRLTISRYTHLL